MTLAAHTDIQKHPTPRQTRLALAAEVADVYVRHIHTGGPQARSARDAYT